MLPNVPSSRDSTSTCPRTANPTFGNRLKTERRMEEFVCRCFLLARLANAVRGHRYPMVLVKTARLWRYEAMSCRGPATELYSASCATTSNHPRSGF